MLFASRSKYEHMQLFSDVVAKEVNLLKVDCQNVHGSGWRRTDRQNMSSNVNLPKPFLNVLRRPFFLRTPRFLHKTSGIHGSETSATAPSMFCKKRSSRLPIRTMMPNAGPVFTRTALAA